MNVSGPEANHAHGNFHRGLPRRCAKLKQVVLLSMARRHEGKGNRKEQDQSRSQLTNGHVTSGLRTTEALGLGRLRVGRDLVFGASHAAGSAGSRSSPSDGAQQRQRDKPAAT